MSQLTAWSWLLLNYLLATANQDVGFLCSLSLQLPAMLPPPCKYFSCFSSDMQQHVQYRLSIQTSVLWLRWVVFGSLPHNKRKFQLRQCLTRWACGQVYGTFSWLTWEATTHCVQYHPGASSPKSYKQVGWASREEQTSEQYPSEAVPALTSFTGKLWCGCGSDVSLSSPSSWWSWCFILGFLNQQWKPKLRQPRLARPPMFLSLLPWCWDRMCVAICPAGDFHVFYCENEAPCFIIKSTGDWE